MIITMSIRFDRDSFDCQWECPACGSGNLNYWTAEIDWNNVSYDWTCWDCGSQWVEWYVMEFYSQHLDYDWTKKLPTEDERRERENPF